MSSETLEINDRLGLANRFLQVISQLGQHFFYNPETRMNGFFELDRTGKLWLFNAYTGRRVLLHPRHPWDGFSGGPHQMMLIKALRHFIIFGHRLNPDYFRQKLNGRDHPWGYGEAIETVCAAGQSLAVIAKQPTILARTAS